MKSEKTESFLAVKWSKKEKDLVFPFFGYKSDARMLYGYFCIAMSHSTLSVPSLVDELEKRGYDLTTLKFSIKKKKTPLEKEG